LKAALIQVRDYRLLGASGFLSCDVWSDFYTMYFIFKTAKIPCGMQPSWSEGGTTRHNFGRGPSNDYFIKVWFQLSNWFQTRRFLCVINVEPVDLSLPSFLYCVS
jgi:hypothetical protein